MMQKKSCLLFILLLPVLLFAQETLQVNPIYKNTIHSVKMGVAGWEISYPVIELYSESQVQLSFDDLSDEIQDYTYKIVHCNADWSRSDLAENEYLEGFFENQIPQPRASFNTMRKFYHYELKLPNNDVQLKVSGNYMLMVYNDFNINEPILSQRFSVYESKTQIFATAKRSILAKYSKTHQQVDFRVDLQTLEIADPFSDITIAVVQNNIWPLARTDLKPQFVQNKILIYEDPDENAYRGFNEFRMFDTKNLDYAGAGIAKIFFEDNDYYVRLLDDDDKRFKVYLNEKDINGAYIVRNREYDDHDVDSDYSRVYFYLPMPEPLTDGDLYINGELCNWNLTERNKMEYNYEKKAYQLMLILKQGYYNYHYVFSNKQQKDYDPQRIEGSHFETENNYLIYVYARPFGSEYDHLVGFLNVNTVEDNQTIYEE
ncbi:MAG: DUF5103 domain-containing protein [Bacteroidales bacterium]|nr:DUF5103 domain-containing protein [Bacteroidales bacterium]